MPIPSAISDLSQTAGSNSPAGSDSPSTLDDYQRAHASFIALLRDGKGFAAEATVASAATCDIGAANSLFVQITGTTTITSFGTNYTGPRFVRFAAALTLTNSSALVLPGGANITTAAGDTCIAVPQASGWRVVSYERAASLPMVGNGPAFSAYPTGTQSLANGVQTKIQLAGELFDTAGAFDSTTNYRFQPQVAGYYWVEGTVTLGSASNNVLAVIYKNGVGYKQGTTPSSGLAASVGALVFLNGTTDYVELYGYQAGGSSVSTSGGLGAVNHFHGFLVRAA